MEGKVVKTIVGFAECVIGSLFLIAALWSLSNIFSCPKDSSDCEGWAILGAYMTAPIGISLLIAGVALLKSKSLYSQLAVLPALGWLVYWWLG
ncbi:hypothetical protein [Agarilytica rhodophyticola]|uniref:hypothetical protein n=1 Tax=Agarilytica rhodophyticola TaxID=1737490 RepID=UPI000B343E5E|nr:hypothetical protein [Agarilytica rhodophyticola]